MHAAEVVRGFFERVRSGANPDEAHRYMADRVLAHQVTAENETTVERSPAEYAAHVREMQDAFGPFRLVVEELIAQDDRVYVRWRQIGNHVGAAEGFQPTGKPVIEIASAVYRVADGKIAEYWMQIDREGIRVQLERNAQ
ncbi:ester cyclase [Paenibacillus sacheonensis]|uniref:Ester cyclase n=1 Tax=Paenibacillus sacheonensis TaxID=742054 RepID=A0A7X4YR01_9BACL|nr:ester cyclase [Paenibacillus sacheonensis]MBM7567124.1 putative ester cyclase [Paenibacillus sacheonensis]NBC70947.1 ester cyclase [Paenibacillus sacheonensis]